MRQVICKDMPDADGFFLLKGESYKHLALSLRKKIGEHINIRLQDGALFEAEIVEVSKEGIKCKVVCSIEEDLVDVPLLCLLQWELKGEKMDLVIRQATEIGATHIMPIFGEYSVPRAKNPKEKERREKLIVSAREQSGSAIETAIFPTTSLEECLRHLEKLLDEKKSLKIFAYEKLQESSKSILASVAGDEEAIVVCIGAEGGISNNEYDLLSKKGFFPIHFNTNILKAETAAIYALSSLKEAYVYKKI